MAALIVKIIPWDSGGPLSFILPGSKECPMQIVEFQYCFFFFPYGIKATATPRNKTTNNVFDGPVFWSAMTHVNTDTRITIYHFLPSQWRVDTTRKEPWPSSKEKDVWLEGHQTKAPKLLKLATQLLVSFVLIGVTA